MTKSLFDPLGIDPNCGVLDLPGAARMGAFEVARQNLMTLAQHLARLGIDDRITTKAHCFDAEVAEVGSGRRITLFGKISAELHETLGGKDTQALADRELAAKAMLVLEGRTELRRCVDPSLGCLIEQDRQDHVAFAVALCIMLCAHFRPRQTLVQRVDLDPLAAQPPRRKPRTW